MSNRRFDISWTEPPPRGEAPTPRGDDFEGGGSLPAAKPPKGYGDEPERRDREHELDGQLLQALKEHRALHVVDLARLADVEFEAALRSVLRLAARRRAIIEQRDPLANDHLVAAAR